MKISNTLLLTIILFGLLTLSCQEKRTVGLTNSQERKVDSLTGHWNLKEKPGGAIAILKDGDIFYQNVFGQADVSEAKPNSEQTGFQLAQISDSFVAYALLYLSETSKLSLEDTLSKHLPFTSSISPDIKVRHLLQQTSGIYDFEVLKNIVGWSDQNPFSDKDALSLIQSQKEASFAPGTEFSPSRSNIFLAVQVIESFSKKPFSRYIEESIFGPLGMHDTFVLTDSNQDNPQMAKSYRNEENGAITTIPSKKETYASINVVSSISDMVKWEQNLLKPNSSMTKTIQKFNSYVELDNGKTYDVPAGRLTYGQKYVHKERGINTAMSTGGIDGFASAIFNFPSERFTTITLSNNGEGYNGYIGMLSAHAILGDVFTEPTTTDYTTLKTFPIDTSYHKKYEGMYWDALGELSREIRIENDTLRYIRSNGNSSALIPLSKDRFQLKTDFDDKIYLTFNETDERITMQYFYGDANPFDFVKYTPKTPSHEELQVYEGNYICDALGIDYSFTISENSLIASNEKIKGITFNYIKDEVFQGDQWFMGSIEFKRADEDYIQGFYVRNDLIRNLWFKKDRNIKTLP
ncbi:serine hydrolase domain-containing protein [uncultured Croceitalea sp.]|uniref:serine hydrolase domain-containing protein n=1 Tax=uncultured Croceitalea sp. TaxID=1798908 RepID=UPI003305B70D